MKIRSDFVTNSSSSSFIFKDDSSRLVREAVARRLSTEPKDEWEYIDYELARRWSTDIIGTPFEEHVAHDLREVYEWYRDELVSRILGVEQWEYWSEKDDWNENIKKSVSANWSDEKVKKKLAAALILDIYGSVLWNDDISESIGGAVFIHQEHIDAYIWDQMCAWNEGSDILHQVYLDNMTELMVYTKEFEGKTYADVMEHLFEAKYLYFDDMETHYLICEALKEAEFCIYSCGHMG